MLLAASQSSPDFVPVNGVTPLLFPRVVTDYVPPPPPPPPRGPTPDPYVAPASSSSSTPAPAAGGGGPPSIGYGYTPPPRSSSQTPASSSYDPTSSNDSPPQLPTVTTWASSLSSHWVLVAAIALAVVLIVAYRRYGK